MKRILLEPLQMHLRSNFLCDEKDGTLQEICNFVSELRLLKDVPFSYLIPDEKLLPPESIRFFYLDENWLDAFTDGAMSIGRVAAADALIDGRSFNFVASAATQRLSRSRFLNMHPNHRRRKEALPVSGKARTGFILRSGLVGKWRGLEAFGYHEETLLEILRMDTLADDILLCIFDGELTKFVISEPKTGLRFGVADNEDNLILKSIREEDFGTPIEDAKVDVKRFTDERGKIDVAGLARRMGELLDVDVRSPELAFELIAVAKRAEFLKGGGALGESDYSDAG